MFRGITARIFMAVLGVVLLTQAAVLGYNYVVSRDIIENESRENAHNLGLMTANMIGRIFGPIESTVKATAAELERLRLSPEKLPAVNRRVLEDNPDIFGMAIALEPYATGPDKCYHAPYYYRDHDGRLQFTMLGGDDYNYFNMPWYSLPKALGHPIWSEPYFDKGGGNQMMVTYSVPFFRIVKGKRLFAGIITADLSLNWLREAVSKISFYQSGYAVVTSRSGTYVYHPIAELVLNQTVFSMAASRNDPQLNTIGQNMIDGKTGFVERKSFVNDKDSFLFYTPLPIEGWSLALLFPKDEMLADANRLLRTMLIIGILGCLLLAAAILWCHTPSPGPYAACPPPPRP